MGLGTVFFGLICLIILTTIMGNVCRGLLPEEPAKPAAPAPAAAAPAPVAAAPVPAPVQTTAYEPDRAVIAAAISAAIAEELGTDFTGIRILSMKKL